MYRLDTRLHHFTSGTGIFSDEELQEPWSQPTADDEGQL